MTLLAAPEDRASAEEQYLEDPMSVLRIDDEDAAAIKETITEFYQNHLQNSGMDGYVIGLSGGLDSSVVAYLLADAVGSNHVHSVIMPPSFQQPEDWEDARDVASELGITLNNPAKFQKEIGGIVDGLEELGEKGEHQRLKRGNILARCRMIVLRDTAKARNALVAGTTNASERDMGYMTLAADGKGGVDNEAIYNLYKTMERDLAQYLGVPERIVTKTPSADLWAGQTDKAELGFTYDIIDQVLAGLQIGVDQKDIARVVDGVSQADVEKILQQKKATWFKRELAPHPEFSLD